MNRNFIRTLLASLLLLCCCAPGAFAAEPELVNIKSVDRSILVELRYGTTRNIAQRPLYPANMPALVRPHVAAQLARAQAILRAEGYGLKIWDAYRPKDVHEQLWRLSPTTDYVADPSIGGSLHTCGVAIDATMIDNRGREVSMPTDFDDFTPAAMLQYAGTNNEIRRHLRTLQNAMGRAGFRGMRTEWWHFVSENWKEYQPIPEITIVPQTLEVKGPDRIPVAAPTAARVVTTRPGPALAPSPARVVAAGRGPAVPPSPVPAVTPTPVRAVTGNGVPAAPPPPERVPTKGRAPVATPTPAREVTKQRIHAARPKSKRAVTKRRAPVATPTPSQAVTAAEAVAPPSSAKRNSPISNGGNSAAPPLVRSR